MGLSNTDLSEALGPGIRFLHQSVPFTSLCPKCKREWLQNGYTRRALLELLNTARAIEASCTPCNATWSVSDRERAGIAKRV
jgi:hypothetical protein